MNERVLGCLLLCVAMISASPLRGQVANTVHNLSSSGPGTVKEAGVSEICVFCHTPHRAAPTRALWNRDLPSITYNLYASSTLEATLNQPTGASRLCLSCHDGTTALGNLRVPPAGGPLSLGPLTGAAVQGSDLSDDHPISFVYDATLAANKQGEIVPPSTLPPWLPLDSTQQLQCTTCHDPHDDRYRKFLRADDRASAFCTGCHSPRNWPGSTHATSPATWTGTGTDPWPGSPYTTVADNGCASCHHSHAAPRPPRLLSNAQERAVCLVCHSGAVAGKNLESEFLKASAHPIDSTDWVHDPLEIPNTMARHVTCVDCHNPHQNILAPTSPPGVPGPLRGVKGINLGGGTVAEAAYEYEVCLQCHGIVDQTTIGLVREDNTRNVRVEISTSNPSYHPVAAVGKNTTMGGFEPGYSTASIIGCTDCHNNDEWTTGGPNPRGAHGSRYETILEREYQANDPSSESFQVYALCYKCHNRNYLITDAAGTFPHQTHLVTGQSPCAACHDAHGSRQYPHLINFMLRDRSGKAVVSPSQTEQRLEYNPDPILPGTGQCYLTCHGVNHEPAIYP